MLRKHIEVAILLVESGTVYCLLWIVVAALYRADDQDLFGIDSLSGVSDLWTSYAVFLQGGLVPLVAIYPTAIILNRSQVEKEFWNSRGRANHATTTAPMDSGSAEMATNDLPILQKA
ncbi:hypothetical protein LXA43DRAFT_1093237 [Ganoderma leucocontextum]|nr:hypothetical protein LXA43DRAFT_1093237 [Ganoderma leucocontextum]